MTITPSDIIIAVLILSAIYGAITLAALSRAESRHKSENSRASTQISEAWARAFDTQAGIFRDMTQGLADERMYAQAENADLRQRVQRYEVILGETKGQAAGGVLPKFCTGKERQDGKYEETYKAGEVVRGSGRRIK